MNKKLKQIAASLLSVLMIVCFMPSMAFADDTATPETTSKTWVVVQPEKVEVDYTGSVPELDKLDAFAEIQVKDVNADANTAELLTLKRGTDFSVEADSAGPGTVHAKFTTMGNYAKDKINDMDITVKEATSTSKYAVTVDAAKVAYDGDALTADEVAEVSTVIKDGVENMDLGTGYFVTIDPATAVDAGTKAKVSFFSDSAKTKKIHEEEITIQKRELSTLKFDVTLKDDAVIYNGKAQTPEVESVDAYLGDEEDAADVPIAAADYEVAEYKNNINASEKAVVVLKAKSTSKNFTGTGEGNFEIEAYDLTGASVDLPRETPSVVFNGKAQTPAVSMEVYNGAGRDADKIPAADYKVEYAETINASDTAYAVTIKPANDNVSGELSVANAYKITKANLKDASVTQKKDVPAAVDITVPATFKEYFSVTLGDYELVPGTDFTFGTRTGKWQEKGEKVSVKLNAAGSNFTGENSVSYTAVAKEFAEVYTTSTTKNYAEGQTIRPTDLGTLTEKGGTATLTTADYYVDDWSNNINAGTAIATIKGKAGSQYEGRTAKVEFEILPLAVTATPTVTDIQKGSYYEGCEVKGGTVKVGTKTYKPEDYKIVAKTIDKQNAKLTAVTVKFQGNYTGDKDVTLNPAVDCDIATLDEATVTGDIPAGLAAYDKGASSTDVAAAIQKYITVTTKAGTVVGAEAYTVQDVARADGKTPFGELGSEITFTVKGVYPLDGWTKNCKIKVVQRDMKDFEKNITVSGTYEYNGTAQEPANNVAVSVGDTGAKALVKDTDYTLSWKDNKDAGTATVTLNGKGNYKGSASATFEIAKKTLAPADFKVSGADTVEFTPAEAVDQSSKLSLKPARDADKYEFTASDYTIKLVAGQKAVAKGQFVKYDVTISKDSKNYNEAEYKDVAVSKVITRTATDAEITAEKTSFAIEKYTGKADLGKVTVKVDGVEVDPANYNYDVVGDTTKVTSEVAEAQKPYIEVEFTGGNYVGKAKAPITIVAAEINIKDVNLVAPTGSAAVYSGSAIVPAVKDGGKDKLVVNNGTKKYYTIEYKDASGKVMKTDPVDAGTYTATVKATAAYGGAEGNSVTYTITAKELSKTEFDAKIKNLTLGDVEYLSNETKAPVISGTDADQFEVVSYDKTWDGTKATGNAKVALKDGGNYSYKTPADMTFNWKAGTLQGEPSDYYVIDPQTYTGKALEPALKAKDGSDVSVAWATIKYYENNVNASTKSAKAYVEVVVPTSEKKYTGKLAGYVTFEIVPAEGLVVEVEDATYTGSPVTPAVTVKDVNGAVLKEGTDYSVAFENNTYVGEGTVTVTGKGNYGGSVTKTFKIKEDAAKVEDANKAATEAAKAASAVTEANGYSKEDAAAVKAAADALAAVQAKDNATVKELSDATKALTDAIAKADANKAADKASEAAAGVTAAAGYEAADVTAVKKAANALAAAKAKSGATAAEIQAATKALNAAVATANTNAKKAPAKVKLNKKKTKSAKKGKVTVVWKKVKGAKGYQVKVGNKTYNVKGAKKVKKIFKAKKGKRIAVKVRAYKVFKGKKIYGKWSAAKKVKIKK